MHVLLFDTSDRPFSEVMENDKVDDSRELNQFKCNCFPHKRQTNYTRRFAHKCTDANVINLRLLCAFYNQKKKKGKEKREKGGNRKKTRP
jgi:hypothetical protein